MAFSAAKGISISHSAFDHYDISAAAVAAAYMCTNDVCDERGSESFPFQPSIFD
jgi:hypothetical protein